jgi:4-hydroxyproline epimerase
MREGVPQASKTTFHCIDAHTCGNPVRLVYRGAPELEGESMLDKQQHFIAEYDWIRTSLMFEPRGHAMMSGGFLCPSQRDDCDIGVLFIETTGCLPMCGHGTIGLVTIAIENGLVEPRVPGRLDLETPAGKVSVTYTTQGRKVSTVRLTNVASFLHSAGLEVDFPELGGTLVFDVAYGGNFYAIVEPQPHYAGLSQLSAVDIVRLSRVLRERINKAFTFSHPKDVRLSHMRHVMWTGKPVKPGSDGRNAVFYGDSAIDRSPCGTGTSSRMAQLVARGELAEGDDFIHESYIGSRFRGRVEATTRVGDFDAIVPSIEGWARVYGHNVITVDPEDDPFWAGFIVT